MKLIILSSKSAFSSGLFCFNEWWVEKVSMVVVWTHYYLVVILLPFNIWPCLLTFFISYLFLFLYEFNFWNKTFLENNKCFKKMISCLSVLSDSFHLLSRLLANMNKKKNSIRLKSCQSHFWKCYMSIIFCYNQFKKQRASVFKNVGSKFVRGVYLTWNRTIKNIIHLKIPLKQL
jgi:hypothetical protein